MGYHTGFRGHFRLEPHLNLEQTAFLKAYADLRHNNLELGNLPPLGDQWRSGLTEHVWQDRVPSLYCPWTVTDDGGQIVSQHPDKAYEPALWLGFLLQHFALPWGINVSGICMWQGEQVGDSGVYIVAQSQLKTASFADMLEVFLKSDLK
jgi:hypothetical protein